MSDKTSLDLLDQLEIGSNVFELIEFSLQRNLPDGRKITGVYGVNVAKVREVVRMPKINPLASRIPGVEGIFELRGVPIPAINLNQVLGDTNTRTSDEEQIIVAEFSQKRAGFIVSSTHRIRRIEWDKVMAPSSGDTSFITGMILIEESEFLFILDLEKIIASIENLANGGIGNALYGAGANVMPQPGMNPAMPMAAEPAAAPAPATPAAEPNGYGILLVDDSSIIRNNIQKELEKVGYAVTTANDGQEAYEIIDENSNSLDPSSKIDIVVTDVEMPRMNGITLTEKIREHPLVSGVPILLHSSLSGDATKQMGKDSGADGYVVKNDVNNLIDKIKSLLDNLAQAV